jgi:cell wall-associated NlpC family hydrolase
MTAAPSHAIVHLAALDLRARPDHRAELESQLLMGEVVRILRTSRDGRWLEVENRTDADRGWARRWGLAEVGRSAAAAWEARARARVVAFHTLVRAMPRGGAVLTPAFLGARLVAGRREGRVRMVTLPDGRRGWVANAAIGGGRLTLEARVASLIGVPYLWGGRTPMGLDCSAFTQIVLAERGIALPRDAQEQLAASRRLAPRERTRPGDLIFFGDRPRRADHVGVLLGNGLYAHARGLVRINSTDPSNALYDNELGRQVIGVARPVRGPSRT